MPTVEDNVALVRRAVEAVNTGTVLAGFVAEDCVRHDLARLFPDARGPGGMSDFIREVRAALPDLHIRIEDIFGSDDRVVARLLFTGTHEGEILGMAATHKELVFHAIHMYQLRDGKLVATWQLPDMWGFFSQIYGRRPLGDAP